MNATHGHIKLPIYSTDYTWLALKKLLSGKKMNLLGVLVDLNNNNIFDKYHK